MLGLHRGHMPFLIFAYVDDLLRDYTIVFYTPCFDTLLICRREIIFDADAHLIDTLLTPLLPIRFADFR